jgi:hypothetical protein
MPARFRQIRRQRARHNLAHRAPAGLRVGAQLAHHLAGDLDRDRNGGLGNRQRARKRPRIRQIAVRDSANDWV